MKMIFAIFLLTVSSSVFAGGQYDGIWYSKDTGYYSIHENNGTVIIVGLSHLNKNWGTSEGARNGNTILAKSVEGSGVVRGVTSIIMTSDTTFTAVQESCERIYQEYYCLHPDGYTFYGQKVQG